MVAIINPFVTTREQLALAGLQTIPDPLIKLRWAESESISSNQLNTRYSPNMRTVMVGKWTAWTLDTGTVGHIQESRINDELTVQHRHNHSTQVDTNIWESKQKYLSGFEIVNIMLAMHTNSTLGKYPLCAPFTTPSPCYVQINIQKFCENYYTMYEYEYLIFLYLKLY